MDLNNSPDSQYLQKPVSERCETPAACTTVGLQYADISVPVELKPNAIIGKIKTECCGKPLICCKENSISNTCEITITQKVCIKIPISYSAAAIIGDVDIHCCNDK